MQPIDCLDGRRRIEKRSVRQRPLGDVDEHAQAERYVLVQSPFGAKLDRADRGVGVDPIGGAGNLEQRRACRHEIAQ